MTETNSNYQKLVDKLHNWLDDIKDHEVRSLAEGVDLVSEWAQTGLEIHSEQLQQNVEWLKRDLANFYSDYQHETQESPYYLRIKDQIWHTLAELTDKTQIEWHEIKADFAHQGEYKTGEEVALGILVCKHCGNKLEITHPQRIHECTECGHHHFIRLAFAP